MTIESLPTLIKPACKRWGSIPAGRRQRRLSNVCCRQCHHETTIVTFNGTIKGGDLLLAGKGATGQGDVARVGNPPDRFIETTDREVRRLNQVASGGTSAHEPAGLWPAGLHIRRCGPYVRRFLAHGTTRGRQSAENRSSHGRMLDSTAKARQAPGEED